MKAILTLLLVAIAVLVGACSSSGGESESDQVLSGQPSRDWTAHPAVLEVDEADEIYAVSDVHGAYVEFGRLLEKSGIISNFSIDPSRATSVRWTGGTAILVVAGDVIDKGRESVGVIDMLRSLESKARARGGLVVVTMGNHEAEFLADPLNDKALATTSDGAGISVELRARGIDPKEVALGRDREGRGAWLLTRPFAVRIKKWFFSHGGNTGGDSLEELSTKLRKAIDRRGYGADEVIGSRSILEDQEWYGDDYRKAKRFAEALGVEHLAFGHDPGALNDRGKIKAVRDGLLVKLNVNMGLASASHALVSGALLHVKTRGRDSAEALEGDGTERPLF